MKVGNILNGLGLEHFNGAKKYTQTFVARANIGRAAYNKCDDAFYSQGIHIKRRTQQLNRGFLQTLFKLHIIISWPTFLLVLEKVKIQAFHKHIILNVVVGRLKDC